MKRTICKQLFLQHSFEEIAPAFTALWKYNEPEKAGNLDLDRWKEIYQSLQGLETTSSPYYIRLGYRWEGCMPIVDMNCSVCDEKNRKICHPVAVHPSWTEIMGMKISIARDVKMSQQELAAGMLWEITYYGGMEEIAKTNLMK